MFYVKIFALAIFGLARGQSEIKFCPLGGCTDEDKQIFRDSLNKNLPLCDAINCRDEITKFVRDFLGKRTLMSDFCDTYGDRVYSIDASSLGIESIDIDAFWECKNLVTLSLSKNNIERLYGSTFFNNEKLQILSLGANKISFLPDYVFYGLNRLHTLWVSGNPLKDINPILHSEITQLKELGVANVGLEDLSVNKLKEALPNLNNIYIRNNGFTCNRLQSLTDELVAQDVRVIDEIQPEEEGNSRRCYETLDEMKLVGYLESKMEADFEGLFNDTWQRINDLKDTFKDTMDDQQSSVSDIKQLLGDMLDKLDKLDSNTDKISALKTEIKKLKLIKPVIVEVQEKITNDPEDDGENDGENGDENDDENDGENDDENDNENDSSLRVFEF